MSNLTDDEAVNKVVEAVSDLSSRLNIPKSLREVGIPDNMFETLAEQAINDPCTPGNPRSVTVEDIVKIYKEAY